MTGRTRTFTLFAAWGLCLGLGLVSAAVLLAGILRDTHFGQAELALDLGHEGGWSGSDFRVWGGGGYVLWLTSLGPQPPFDPAAPDPPTMAVPYQGRFAVRILEPNGNLHREWTYAGDEPAHIAGSGTTWSQLGDVTLRDLPLRTWRLEARTAAADPTFASGDLTSRLLLRPDRAEVGMGGLLNYVLIVPAVLFLALSIVPALLLVRRTGRRWPAWVSALSLVMLAGLFTIR